MTELIIAQSIVFFIGQYIFIYPFLFVVGIFDFLFGLILPYKYDDASLPDKNSVLTLQTNIDDPRSPYRSTMTDDLLHISDKNLNLYSTLVNKVDEYADTETMGIREVLNLEDEQQPNGKVFKKYNLANSFTWSSYRKF